MVVLGGRRRRRARLRPRARPPAEPREGADQTSARRSARGPTLLVGALAFLETGAFVGLIAPGETAMLLGGVVAGQGKIDVLALIAIVWTCAVAGDMTSFYLGRRLGRGFLVRARAAGARSPRSACEQVEAFFDRHGGKAILLGRFVGLVRAVAPFLAGSSGMPLRRFVPYDVIGAGALERRRFVIARLRLLAELQHRSSTTPRRARSALGVAIALVVGIVVAGPLAARGGEPRARAATGSSASASGRSSAPVVARARAGRRAARAAGALRVGPRHPGRPRARADDAVRGGGGRRLRVRRRPRAASTQLTPIAGDAAAMRIAHRLDGDLVVSVAKVVTALGTFPAAAALIVGAAAFLVSAWRPDRSRGARARLPASRGSPSRSPRPRSTARARPAASSTRSARPSRRGTRPTRSRGSRSRVALVRALRGRDLGASRSRRSAWSWPRPSGSAASTCGAHYLSDVVAGWGLGAAIFALCGVAAPARRPRAEQSRREAHEQPESIIYLVAGSSAVFVLAAYVGLIVVPAWTAYSRVWERLAATFLSLYVLAGFIVLGVAGGRRRDLVLGPLHRLTGARARLPGRDSHVPFVKCPRRHSARRPDSDLAALDPIADAVESGAGLPEVLRAAARALDASLAVCRPRRHGPGGRGALPGRRALAAGRGRRGRGARTARRRRAGRHAAHPRAQRSRRRRCCGWCRTLVASEVERLRAPERASAAALASFLRAVLGRDLSAARTSSRGPASSASTSTPAPPWWSSACAPLVPTDDGWRERVLAVADRGARGANPAAVAAARRARGRRRQRRRGHRGPPGRRRGGGRARRRGAAARAADRAAGDGLRGRPQPRRHRPGRPAPRRPPRRCWRPTSSRATPTRPLLAFEDTGAYRLLLSAMSEDPAELQRFYAETVEPLVAYDEQYETDLVQTVEAFLDADGNVAGTAQRLFTHRHTVRYRLERVKELCGPGRRLDRRAREAVARAQGDARARARPSRRSGVRGGSRAAAVFRVGHSGNAPRYAKMSRSTRILGHSSHFPRKLTDIGVEYPFSPAAARPIVIS